MYIMKLNHHFDASHKLCLDYESPCQNMHGHRWEVNITIKGNELNSNGMVVDFKRLKEIVNSLDHQNLNDVLNFNPTAENIAKYLYAEILIEVGIEYSVEVEVLESPGASIIYKNQ